MTVKNETSLIGSINDSDSKDKKSSFRVAIPQVLAVFVKNILLIGYGMTMGYPTILIPNLVGNNPKASMVLNDTQISWISSINLIAVPIGCLLSGALTQAIGRKRGMQIVNVPMLGAWLLFAYYSKVWHIYLALFMTGSAGGLMEAPVMTYVAEITQPKLRGMLSATSTLAVILGIFVEFLLGTFLPWRTVALVSCAAPVLSILLLFLVPESPHWLIMKDKFEEAKNSLAWLRGWTEHQVIEPEYDELCRSLGKAQLEGTVNPAFEGQPSRAVAPKKTKKEHLQDFLERKFFVPYLLVSFVFFVSSFSGIMSVQTYAVQIFAALRVPIDKYYATVMFGCAQVLGCLICVTLIHYLGKRSLTFFSTVGSAICTCVVAAYAYKINVHHLINHKVEMINATNITTPSPSDLDVDSYSWIPITFMIVFAFVSHCGIRVLPWILIGEVFDKDTRATAAGLSGGIGYIFSFLANKIFLSMISGFTLPGTFWTYSVVSGLGTVLLYFGLPETEGKSLHEITQHFAGIAKMDNTVKRNRSRKSTTNGHVNHGYGGVLQDSYKMKQDTFA